MRARGQAFRVKPDKFLPSLHLQSDGRRSLSCALFELTGTAKITVVLSCTYEPVMVR